MAQLNSVSPVELEPETVVLSFMAVFPFALYAAGRVLLWNPEVSLLLHQPARLYA